MDWKWNSQSDTWLCGESNDGAGVFRDVDDSITGNVVCGSNITCLGTFDNLLTAMDAAERELLRQRTLMV